MLSVFSCFVNTAPVLDTHKHSTPKLKQARFPDFQEWGHSPAEPRRLRLSCSLHWGTALGAHGASAVSPRDGRACEYPDETVFQMLCAISQQQEWSLGQICNRKQCEPLQRQDNTMWDRELTLFTNNDTNQEPFHRTTELLSPLPLHTKGYYPNLKISRPDLACTPRCKGANLT